MKRTTTGLAALVLGPVMAVGAVVPAAQAGPFPTVDPASVTPPLNPDFAPWTCEENGAGIVCRGGARNSYDEPTDIPCDEGFVHVVGQETVSMTRWHDGEGRALSTLLHTSYDDTLWMTVGGPFVQLFAHWQKHYDYPVPGDVTRRVLRETGAIMRVRAPGGGTVFQDTGLVEYVPDEEYDGLAVLHGVHDRFLGVDLGQAVCDALRAG